MKYFVLCLLLFFNVNLSYGAFEAPHITVFGSAERHVIPDEIRWVLSVKTEGTTTLEVAKIHTGEVAKVLRALESLGQHKGSVLTTNMQLKENWLYRNNKREKNGYYAFTEIDFKSKDFSAYVKYWSQLTALTNVSVVGVTFGLSSRSDIEDQLKIKAIKQGREKAVDLAAALGAEIGNPMLIEELDNGTYFPREGVRAMAMKSDTGGQQVISPGKEVVKARIKLVFTLKTP